MKRAKLGDSYDIVKRFLRDTLSPIAPLVADAYFLAPSLRTPDYERATGITVRSGQSAARIGLLLDPHTGIHVADELLKGRYYATTRYIITALQARSIVYCIVFDQSYYRDGVPRRNQLQPKLDALAHDGILGFYYLSHAPFLFAARSQSMKRRLRNALRRTGLPNDVFYPNEVA